MPTKNKDEMRDFAIYKLYLESRINDTSIQNIANTTYGIIGVEEMVGLTGYGY